MKVVVQVTLTARPSVKTEPLYMQIEEFTEQTAKSSTSSLASFSLRTDRSRGTAFHKDSWNILARGSLTTKKFAEGLANVRYEVLDA